MYGSGPEKVAATAGIPLEEAVEAIDDYFGTYKQLKKWLEQAHKKIKEDKCTYSIFGRKRRLPNVDSSDRKVSSHEVRSGTNFLIQSVCSDLNLLAAIDMHNWIKQSGFDANIFMLVHDSIVAEVREDLVDDYCKMLAYLTQMDRGCMIPGSPIGVDVDIGDDYSFVEHEERIKTEEEELAEVRFLYSATEDEDDTEVLQE